MVKRNRKPGILAFFISVLFLLSAGASCVLAYGGGGGGGGAGVGDSTVRASDVVKVYTRTELEAFFSGLPDKVRDMIINKQEGKPRSPAQLNLIRNIFLQAESFQHQSEEAYWQSYEDLAVLLDKTGQNAELVLAFTTGGTSTFVTGTLFGATRAAANEYSKDKSVSDIIQAIAVTVAVDQIMKIDKLSKIGERGNKLVDMVYRANKLNKNPRVLKYLTKVAIKAGIHKEGENFTKSQISNILNYVANKVRTTEVKTSVPYRSPMIYRNQAGIW
jgi:hypothetical protein